MFFKRSAAHATLSICFLFFAAKQNVHWNVEDWNKDTGGKQHHIGNIIVHRNDMKERK